MTEHVWLPLLCEIENAPLKRLVRIMGPVVWHVFLWSVTLWTKCYKSWSHSCRSLSSSSSSFIKVFQMTRQWGMSIQMIDDVIQFRRRLCNLTWHFKRTDNTILTKQISSLHWKDLTAVNGFTFFYSTFTILTWKYLILKINNTNNGFF